MPSKKAKKSPPSPSATPLASDPNRVRFAYLRQIGLFGGLAAGIVLFFFTDLSPYIAVSWVDFAHEQESLPRWKAPELKDLSLEDFVKAETKGKTLQVEGPEWEGFIQAIRAWEEVGSLPEEWQHRVIDYSYYRGSVYFRPEEPPFPGLMTSLQSGEVSYLLHPEAGYVQVSYNPSPEGPGLMYSGTDLPTSLLYPYRQFGVIFIAAAVICCILIPWPKRREGLVNVSWLRILPHIIVGLLLGVFFLLPFLIVGGSVETITEAFPITVICWAFAIGAVIVVYISAKVESVSISIQPDGLQITSLTTGVEFYRYEDIAEVRGLVLRPPKWLSTALILSAPLAPTAGTALSAVGQSAILSASQGGGFRIVGRDGRSVCIWFTDQMGGVIFRNFDQLLEAFEAHSVKTSAEPEVLRAFFPPDR